MALHRVTDDFIAHLAALGDDADLDETTEFLVVAATLLDLKGARLLPGAEVEGAEGLAPFQPACRRTRRWRTRRPSPCSRPATSCSPACCSTARTSRSQACSSSWRR